MINEDDQIIIERQQSKAFPFEEIPDIDAKAIEAKKKKAKGLYNIWTENAEKLPRKLNSYFVDYPCEMLNTLIPPLDIPCIKEASSETLLKSDSSSDMEIDEGKNEL